MSRKKIESTALPGKKEWKNPVENDLDAHHTYSNFFGKSLVEAAQMFQTNTLHFQKDLGDARDTILFLCDGIHHLYHFKFCCRRR